MDTQEQSPLLSLPLEVRQAIFAYVIPSAIHVFLQQGKLAVSACVKPEIASELAGWERRPWGDEYSETLFGHRLQSSWGPHWQCEEAAGSVGGMGVFFVCKKL